MAFVIPKGSIGIYLYSNISEDNFISNFVNIIKSLQGVVDTERYKLERIARTESHHVQTMAREKSYSENVNLSEQKFKWVGPNQPGRTTINCTLIKARTAKGVTLDELKQIVREESDPKTYNPARPFTPHINCRHTFVRRV